MSVLLNNIQRFCVHDGPGIRTTIFLKGCNIRCPWCANPENLKNSYDYYVDKTKCIRDHDRCTANPSCSYLRSSAVEKNDYKKCKVNAIGIYGKPLNEEDILFEIVRDKAFYGNDGGVTLSGGEALLHIDCIEHLLKLILDHDINLSVETGLFVSALNLKKAIQYFDYFIVDVKTLDSKVCREILKGNLQQFLTNLDYLFLNVPANKITLRMPLVRDITYTQENMKAMTLLLNKYKPEKCEIFSVHNLGRNKYESLGLNYREFSKLSDEELESTRKLLLKSGVPIQINKL